MSVTTEEMNASSSATSFAKRGKLASAVYTAREVADLLQVSLRRVWQMRDAGEIPQPFPVGRLVRWSRTVIDEWIATGCPRPAKRK
jgi:excisionase family DNA binding protein